ncbi:MAG: 50S ribosomal protein L6 [Planctomycetota bacterium]
MSNMLKPVNIPDSVTAEVDNRRASFRGPKGELDHEVPRGLKLEYDADGNEITVERDAGGRELKALHGLHRSLLNNKVIGVTEGYEKTMEIHGTGYNLDVRRDHLVLQIGFCHDVELEIPESVEIEIEREAAQPDNPARFTVKGVDKEVLGQFCADIRDVRPPEPYKGKGIRYADEQVRRKEGKAFAGLE